MTARRRLFRPRDLPASDIIAIGNMLSRLHCAIALVPGDPSAKTMTQVFIDAGIYRKSASSFTAREGSDPLTKRGHRLFSLVPEKRKTRKTTLSAIGRTTQGNQRSRT